MPQKDKDDLLAGVGGGELSRGLSAQAAGLAGEPAPSEERDGDRVGVTATRVDGEPTGPAAGASTHGAGREDEEGGG